MKCPSCNNASTRVVDSRDIENDFAVRRRRMCEACSYRFTTFERIEFSNLVVIKKNNQRQPYDRQKIRRGIERSITKLPIAPETINEVLGKIETEICGISTSEIPAKKIGQLVMKHLKKLDKVAYIRYASVYKEFEDIDTLEKELSKLLRRRKKG